MDDLGTRVATFATFATLINRRVVIPSERTQYIAVDRHFLFECMRPLINRIKVDERWYETAYPDVSKAVQSGEVSSPREHFYKFGYFEHRMPQPIKVDEAYYIQTNPDVADAVRTGIFGSAQEHFEMAGYREGRLPYPGFSLVMREIEPEVLAALTMAG